MHTTLLLEYQAIALFLVALYCFIAFFGQLALFAEYERELSRQQTKAGMEAAKKRGQNIGRPRKLTRRQVQNIRNLLKTDPNTKRRDIADHYGVSLCTLNRALG